MKVDELDVWEKLQKKLTWEQLGEFGVMGAHYAEQNTVIGMDPDEQTLLQNTYDGVEQICGDITCLSEYADRSFDIILCHNVLEYASERAQIMKEFQRLLKDGGLLSVLKHNRSGRVMQRVSDVEEYRNIAFFHHILLRKAKGFVSL